jgi:hypothetical protein
MKKEIAKCKYCGKIVNPKKAAIVTQPIYGHLGIDDIIFYYEKCKG